VCSGSLTLVKWVRMFVSPGEASVVVLASPRASAASGGRAGAFAEPFASMPSPHPPVLVEDAVLVNYGKKPRLGAVHSGVKE